MTEFEYIYEKNFPIVYKYVLSLCRNASLAEEITQETFVKAIEHMERFNGRCQLYVWLCQIAKNTYFSHLRKQKNVVREDWIQLPEPYREVFSLRVLGELSFSQIGELFEKTDSWARLVYYRAKKRIREGLDE